MTKLVEGNYPNFRQVIPDSFARSVAIPRLPFADALNRVSMVVSENSSAVKLSFSAGQLVLSASSVEYGEASEPVDVSFEGENVEISFNPVFFSDPLKYLDCDQLIIQFNANFDHPTATGAAEHYVVQGESGEHHLAVADHLAFQEHTLLGLVLPVQNTRYGVLCSV